MNPEYSKQAEKFLDSQDNKQYARIKTAVAKLPKGDVIKMQGTKDKYRLRVGSIRVIFTRTLNDIYVEEIDSRGQIYK